MDKIKLENLITLERILLEIDFGHKFDLDFNEAYKLYVYLKDIGRITNYAFLIQNDFSKAYGEDKDKVMEYHNNVMNSMVEFDYKEIVKFIDWVLAKINDKRINSILETNKFW